MKKCITLLSLLFLSAQISLAQSDNIAWLNATLKVPLSERSSFHFKPIFRYNEDFSTYQNSSIDYGVHRKLSGGFSVILQGRTWFLPNEGGLRQFIWTDLNHTYKRETWSLLNKVRYHWALDVDDKADSDFIRYLLKYSLAVSPKVKIGLGAEPWLRLNDFNEFQRVRYHASIGYKLNSKVSLGLNYWREQNWNGLAGDRSFNVFLPGIVYTGALADD